MPSAVTFEEIFRQATGFSPYPYQAGLATARELPSRLEAPTGLGKTAAVTMAWLWRRRFAEAETRAATPRRLVYCLPMRVLVEQTAASCRAWLRRLELLAERAPEEHPADRVAVHVLMGGDLERDWDRWPERDQLLVGTQDMLLSRALNRGYAMSRFRWPVQFGLLNNDCLWVMDEVQLMGSGLATTTQLQALRRLLGAAGPARSIWMSATMEAGWLETVDVDRTLDAPGKAELGPDDLSIPAVAARFGAKKDLEQSSFSRTDKCDAEADLVMDVHREGTRTLVVVNTVKRAQAVFKGLKKRKPAARLVLLHSRFRPADRDAALDALLAEPGEQGTICVATQVVEAGVDVSAATLITDLAPWSSMVQRFGRCNRAGEIDDALVIWIEPPDLDDDKKAKVHPYSPDELREARERLRGLSDVGPRSLPAVTDALVHEHVLRRRDLLDLFDTTPDLAGADIDVSRFIRETEAQDVQVFWRDFEGDAPSAGEPRPRREELCRVPLGEMKKKVGGKKPTPCWRWDHLERRWAPVELVYPGLVLLLPASAGGYSSKLGWTGAAKPAVEPVAAPPELEEANDDDALSSSRRWQTLAEHTDLVVEQLGALLTALGPLAEPWRGELEAAARWHDAGKAHEVFQRSMLGDPPGNSADQTWAKTARATVEHERPGFRHELASALAMLGREGCSDLAAYLAAAHHGKVRLSIRSLPHERRPPRGGARFARGLWDGDVLRAADLGGSVRLPETTLDLSPMELGEGPRGPSWLARALALRDSADLGPFRLAWLEALLRVADWRASGATTQKGGAR